MAQNSFPSLSILFTDSWKNFKNSVLPLFLFSLLCIGISLIAVIILILVLGISGVGVGALISSKNLGLETIIPLIMGAGVILVLFFIIMLILGTAFQIGNLLIVAENNKKTHLKKILRSSLTLVIPLLLTGFISFILIMGGLFFLVLPAIFVGFLLCFVNYEVVFNNKRYLQALSSSATLVLNNFWEILGRLILLMAIGVALGLLPVLVHSDELSGVVIFISVIARVLFSWFSACYMYQLYKQASARSQVAKSRVLWWVWTISLLGWAVVVIIGIIVFQFIASGGASKIFQDLQKSSPLPLNMTALTELKPLAERSQILFTQIKEEAEKDPSLGPSTKAKIIKLNNENITLLRKAVKIAPNIEVLWAMLCQAYQIPNTIGSEKEQNQACEKSKNYTPETPSS